MKRTGYIAMLLAAAIAIAGCNCTDKKCCGTCGGDKKAEKSECCGKCGGDKKAADKKECCGKCGGDKKAAEKTAEKPAAEKAAEKPMDHPAH